MGKSYNGRPQSAPGSPDGGAIVALVRDRRLVNAGGASMAHDVFISYSSEDKPIADAVCAALEARQIRCWVAPRDVLPGQNYAGQIVAAINSADVMVLVFSSKANGSTHVMREVERAATLGRPILPFRIEDVPFSGDIEYYIGTTHWLDALTPPIEKHLKELADTVQRLLARVGGATPASQEQTRVEAEAPSPAGAAAGAKPWYRRLRPRIALGAIAVAVVAAVVVATLYGGGKDGADDGGASATVAANAPPIRIGIALSLTGPGAAKNHCELMKEGFDTELKYMNANGGIMGRVVELIYEDDQSTYEGGRSVIESMVGQDVDAIIGPFAGLTIADAQAIMEEHGILHIPLGPPSDTEGGFDQAELAYWFATAPDENALADAWLRAVVADGRKKVVAIGDELSLHQHALQKVQGSLSSAGIQCALLGDGWGVKVPDLSPWAKRIRDAVRDEGADCLIIASNSAQISQMISALRSLGISQPVYVGNAGADPSTMDAAVGNAPAVMAGNYAVGPAIVNPAALPDDYPSKQRLIDFIARWQADYWGEVPAGIHLGLAYDTIHIAEQALTTYLTDQAANATYPDTTSPLYYAVWQIDWWGAQGHYTETPRECWGVHGGLFQWEYTDSGGFQLVRALN
jgi:ABC-type branched-subunit amino acid transport system substrate-binding protein